MRHFVLSSVLALLLVGVVSSAADAQFFRGQGYYPSYSYYSTPAYSSYYYNAPAYSSYYTAPAYSYYAPPITTFVPQSTSYYYAPEGGVVPASATFYSAPVNSYYYATPNYGYYYPRTGWRWR